VHHTPGTTRDRNEHAVTHAGKFFTLIDTGGWADDSSVFSPAVRGQMETAMKQADLILFTVDSKTGPTNLDNDLFRLLKKQNKPIILVVNKIDAPSDEYRLAEFYKYGITEEITVSAVHGTNFQKLLDTVARYIPQRLPEETAPSPKKEAAIKIILCGKPNVGKSSIINALINEERVIVDSRPGTTREAIEVRLEKDDHKYIITDTPGLHRRHKFTTDMEYLMALSTRKAVEHADVAVLLMDATQEIGETESRIAQIILESGRACVIAMNKWDAVKDREAAIKFIRRELELKMPFLSWVKLLYVSALEGLRLDRLLEEVRAAHLQHGRTLPADELNEVIRNAQSRRILSRRGKHLIIQKTEQLGTNPPAFVFVVNNRELVHFSYLRYLENCIREKFGLEGTPLILKFRSGKRGGPDADKPVKTRGGKTKTYKSDSRKRKH
jgi:GTP-binding protein